MNTGSPPKLIALTGGSGAGKSWLASHLRQQFGDDATSLSLDNFYRDCSHLTLFERAKMNFDHPKAIEWPLFEHVLRELRNGATVMAPRYDFVSHTRGSSGECCRPRTFIIVEGLWPLLHTHMREFFSLRVFLDSPESLRWQRRSARDCNERGRTEDSIREQFWNVVVPMHEQFVEVQKAWADLVIEQPINQTDLDQLSATIRALRSEPCPAPLELIGSPEITTPASTRQHI